MEKQLKAELRKLLTGRTIRDEEGWLVAVPDGSYFIHHGLTDRTGYRKIKCAEARLEVDADSEKAFYTVLDALGELGLLVDMKAKPNALCAICNFFLSKKVVLCVSPEGEGVVLVQAYAGRSLTAGICCRMAISRLNKKIHPEQEN